MRAERANAPTERQIAARFAGWHGVLTTAQLRELGLGRGAIRHRLEVGRLFRVYRRVYSLVAPESLSRKGRLMAAAQVSGPGAVVSHVAALAVHGLYEKRLGVIDVTVPTDNCRRRQEGIRIHRSVTLDAGQRTIRDRIPVTSLARTLVDYADTSADRRAIESVTDQADVRNLLRLDALGQAAEIGGPRKGAARMRRLIAEYQIGKDYTQSELEDEFFRLCDTYGLGRPDAQVQVGPDRIDFLWPDHDLAVETDSWRWHGGRQAWEDDAKRNIRLQKLGLRVIRVSWRRVFFDAAGVAADLRGFLA